MELDPTRRQPIYDLKRKVDFLLESEVGRRVGGYENKTAFYKKSKIPRKTLKGCFTDADDGDGMTSTVQKKLAKCCDFSLDWPEWIDPKAHPDTPNIKRCDTADAFQKKYLEKHAPNENRVIADQKSFAIAVHHVTPPQSINEKLASVTLTADQRGPGETQPIGVELACIPSFLEIAELTVRRGQLRIDCAGSELGDIDERRKFLEAKEFKRNPNDVEIALFGSPLQPGWEISLDDPPSTGWYITGNICEVHKLAPGAVLTARFEVYKKDLEALREPGGSEKSGGAEHKSRAFRFTDFEGLSEAKATILTLLATCAISGDADCVILCKDSLEFRAIEASGGGRVDE